MNKQIGSIMLVAGTCIGSGMLALPLLLAKIGMLPTFLLVITMWSLAYYTALIHLELNLQAGTGLDLGQLAIYFSGNGAYFISSAALALLSYSLLGVYIYGATSIIYTFINSWLSFSHTAALFCLSTGCLLLLPIHVIDYINRILFISLISIVALLLIGLVCNMHLSAIPLVAPNVGDYKNWLVIIPVLFTSFGFQVIFHTLTNYCNKDKIMLKRAFFWGSFIPAFIYLILTLTMLTTINYSQPDFYQHMIYHTVSVGEFIEKLSLVAHSNSIQMLAWIVSLLAIFTSILGVAVGLIDSFNVHLQSYITYSSTRTFFSCVLTLVPAFVIATVVPNAFIKVLGFAGMILVFIAIFIPVYLFYKANPKVLYYSQLKNTHALVTCVLLGIAIVACQLITLFLP